MIGGGGVGGVRPEERALKQRTRRTGVFSCLTGVSHFTCELGCAAGVEKLTVNMHAEHNFTDVVSSAAVENAALEMWEYKILAIAERLN